MSSSITDLEFQTFYVVIKLLDAVYPNGKLYVSHGLSTERDSYRYRAAVVESKIESSGSVKRRLLSQVETAKTRIGVLEAVRKRLEEIASWRLDVIISDKERDDVEENERKRKNLMGIVAELVSRKEGRPCSIRGTLLNSIQKDLFSLTVGSTSIRWKIPIDDLVRKFTNISASSSEASTVYNPVQVLKSISLDDPTLGGIEGIGKIPLPNNLRAQKTASRLAKQERCRSVESQAEEERLQVNDPVTLPNQLDEIIGRVLKDFKVIIVLVL
ncbi:hypothetical protein J4E83_009299 [Alternaria metachromatica]|uniref:uncharacterized protein n=1 Tax=Alternaria metachromatica TaxID=283354 RepID=UPI0020C42171|nr:uncharacterized protein J4E83_009299 [Alternaria metachromatica]KAI4608116.1 hypothetical protein J4E83_009299 [Alternaria metachromatica]